VRIHRERKGGEEYNCAILLDTKGPEIRTGFLKDHIPIQLKAGQVLEITSDYTYQGDSNRISCSYQLLAQSVKKDDKILVADGEIVMEVIDSKESSGIVVVRVQNSAELGERKNMNLPGVSVKLPGITEKDVYDIKNFAIPHKLDIVSGSFIRTAANVQALRECLGEEGKNIRVHAKIESVEGLLNIDEILEAADGIHVSRGDLGMELPLSKLFLAQKMVIHKANIAGKPVVTSTQMLQSMTKNPTPTRAECSDVANAVLDGTDCVMLSGEVASGMYPRESVETMQRIILQAENCIDYQEIYAGIRSEILETGQSVTVIEALSDAAVETAFEAEVDVICVVSETGNLAKLVAKYRPEAKIFVVTANARTARQMSVSRGVLSKIVKKGMIADQRGLTDFIYRYVKSKGWAVPGNRIVVVHTKLHGGAIDVEGVDATDPNLFSNVVKVHIIPDDS